MFDFLQIYVSALLSLIFALIITLLRRVDRNTFLVTQLCRRVRNLERRHYHLEKRTRKLERIVYKTYETVNGKRNG